MAAERIKGPWSPEEDASLQRLVDLHGPRNWSLISRSIPGRSGKSCRLRWCNQLSPSVEHRPFSPEEDLTILRAHAQFGNKWATIARLLSGRTDNAVKNHWNSTLKRRLPDEDRLSPAPKRRSSPSSASSDVSSDVDDDGPSTSLTLSLPGRSGDEEEAAVEAVTGRMPVPSAWPVTGEVMRVMHEMIRTEVRRFLCERGERCAPPPGAVDLQFGTNRTV